MPGICENGHRSATDDYCDVCGLPVHPETPAAPVVIAPPATTQRCPHCGATNPADALFCEACGYDYTTGTLPRADVAGMLGLAREPVVASATPAYPGASSAVPAQSPSAEEIPVAVAEAEGETAGAESSTEDPGRSEAPESVDDAAPATAEAPAPDTEPASAAVGTESPLDTDQPTRGRPAPRREAYVAEVWIDPDWYEVQETDEPMPSVALPTTAVLGPDNLIGRASVSRNIHPAVDCGVDTGVSRRQSRLSTDGTRWYVEDLDSANGTFVGPSTGPLPTEPIHGRYELGPDDRIYVGAWTRIVVRKAAKDEIEALS